MTNPFTCSVYDKSVRNLSTDDMKILRRKSRLKLLFRTSFSQHKGFKLKFLTLTSTPNMNRSLHDSLIIFKHRINRLKYKDFLGISPYTNEPFMTKSKMQRIYGDDVIYRLSDRVPFEYGGVQTSEGAQGVYHFLCYSDYIPFQWIQDNWFEITGAHRVNVQEVRETKNGITNPQKLCNYVISQYIFNQTTNKSECALVQSSHSKGFVSKGYSKAWDLIKSSIKSQLRLVGHNDFFHNQTYFNLLIYHYNELLRGNSVILQRYISVRGTWDIYQSWTSKRAFKGADSMSGAGKKEWNCYKGVPSNEPETRFYLILPNFRIFPIASFFDVVEPSETERLLNLLDSKDIEALKNDFKFIFPENTINDSLFDNCNMVTPQEWASFSV